MLDFLNSFSLSLKLALFIWPFLAAVLTLPMLIFYYRKYNKIVWLRIAIIYSFILYLLALVSFTLYPLPDNPAVFCSTNSKTPLLNPLHVFGDLRSEGLVAVAQIMLNLLFFAPLGFFIRQLFNRGLMSAVVFGLLTSAILELAQLTGLFGIYPCSYRYFDINDLFINTSGSALGAYIAMRVPRKYIDKATKGAVVRKAGLLRHLSAFLLDLFVTFMFAITIILSVFLLFSIDLTASTFNSNVVFTFCLFCIFGLLPYVARGNSLGGYLVRLNHDDRKRGRVIRLVYYIARAVLVILLLNATYGILPLVTFLAIAIIWKTRTLLPHQII